MLKSLNRIGKGLRDKLTFANDRAQIRESGYTLDRSLQRIERLISLAPRSINAEFSRAAQLEQFERDLLKEERYADLKRLSRHEKQVFSQFGEDGIIAEIFRRIDVTSKTFVEIGVGDGLENNTAFLLMQGWSGCWVEGGQEEIEAIQRNFRVQLAEKRLKVKQSFITAENIADTLRELQVPDEIDLLSIDIDRNTYYIWEALGHINARVAVIEYNAAVPADVNWKVAYDAKKMWNGTSYSGASLKAYEELGCKFGYCLVGCNIAGINAFFVREDLCGDKFLAPYDSETHYEPTRYFLQRPAGHPPGFED